MIKLIWRWLKRPTDPDPFETPFEVYFPVRPLPTEAVLALASKGKDVKRPKGAPVRKKEGSPKGSKNR